MPIRKAWVARLIQAVLIIGGIEWIRTMLALVKMRQAMGMPWMRLALILGGVAAFTVCSALVFKFKSLRERYNITPAVQKKSETHRSPLSPGGRGQG